MKKRFIALGLVATMVVGVFSGCGSFGSKSNTMTVSEMLEAVLKDNGGAVYIYSEDIKNGEVLGKDSNMMVYVYDGETVTLCSEVNRTESGAGSYELGDIAQDSISFEKVNNVEQVYGIDIETDSTGNNTYLELLAVEDSKGKFDQYFFGTFSRIEVYDTTFMCFATRVVPQNGNGVYTQYTVIKDTESTKDKTIVWDEVGTDGILVDAMDINQSIYSPAATNSVD